ncbi:DEAD/DEAH box helicase [Enterococcus rivorum]|uniref:DNA/RNA helicase n=1 Tax=Enterococcus rivorum TaxID=762845 RepID=A0A1E5KVY7_9ENTE|nr:helicase-related protein [Enterococcus rivorum]MBP2100249.1 competence protein ComFA [Enterococcus rivorum]OEH82042.1 DNA/RNA helicase [Enterococcus rivorum]
MKELWGRKVLAQELTSDLDLIEAEKYPTIRETNEKEIECLRCGTKQSKQTHLLPNGTYYCSSCIQLGRVDSGQSFYHIAEPKAVERKVFFNWEGQLTDGQKRMSDDLVQSVKYFQSQIIWAVTGAGKTEMLFEAIHFALEKGYRVGLASPRVDVCLELYPRIQAVFSQENIVLLHGKMENSYEYTKLVLCTTHQLLRFHQAFDVLIIDEVDSFPFVNNPTLQYGMHNALKNDSSLIFLTATPTRELLQKINRKELAASILPARYHRRCLPVPKKAWCKQWSERVGNKKVPKVLLQKIKSLIQKNDVLIFCPSIFLMENLEIILKKEFPDMPLTCVHAADEKRLEKVSQMRKKQYRLLITSTILERGVTFDGVSVIVLGANHQVFTTPTLVQIAGRVDRRKEYTAGEVWFLHDGQTKNMKEAIKQIKQMNQLGKTRKLIDEM